MSSLEKSDLSLPVQDRGSSRSGYRTCRLKYTVCISTSEDVLCKAANQVCVIRRFCIYPYRMETWSASDGRYVRIAASDEVGSARGRCDVIARCIQRLFRHAYDFLSRQNVIFHFYNAPPPLVLWWECTWSPSTRHIRPH